MDKPPFTPGISLTQGVVFHIDKNKIHRDVQILDIMSNRRLVVFGGPAPFSKLDTEQALLYEQASDKLSSLGIDAVVAIYVQDAFVMQRFQEEINSRSSSANIEYYGDGDAFFIRSFNLNMDFTYQGLGVRSSRWCAVTNNGIVEWAAFDEYQIINETHPDKVLQWLSQ